MISVFLVALVIVVYTYVVYPALVVLLARWSQAKSETATFEEAVAVIVPCYNEAVHIRAKIDNVLASDYPPDLLRVIVVSDGSTDETAAIAAATGDLRVRVIAYPERCGKIAAINKAVSASIERILVLTDASERFDRAAIRHLVTRLGDAAVGVVSGQLHIVDATSGVSENLGLYWRYETAIRASESEIASVMGVTGSIYAIRRDCFPFLPDDTILDDVAIPLEVIRQGYRVQFEPRAIAYETATADIRSEFARKRRTLAGNYQLIGRYSDLLNPLSSPIAIQFWSHKVLRLVVPYALVAIFVGSWFLPQPISDLLLVTQILFYGLAIVAFFVGDRLRVPILTLPYTFCALNWAAVAGLFAYISGRQTAQWEKVK